MADTPFPKQIRIENTTLCNAHCTICPREKLTRPQGVMDLEFFIDLAGQCARGGTAEMHLQGYGEPFLDKWIFQKISVAKELGIPYTFMVTNASLLNEERIEKLLASGLDKLKISFYGTDAEEYEAVHRNLSFDEVRRNVEDLLKTKKRMGLKKPVISVKYIGSLWRFPRFVLQWWPRAVVSYSGLHNYVDGKRFNRAKVERGERTCPMVTRPIMQVLWDGKVVPCCYDFNGKMVLGDLREQRVQEVWNGPKYEEFRDIHRRRDYKQIPFCLGCDKLR